jgi:hypothetical protein
MVGGTVDLELMTLASTAATTLVGLMATDSWDKVKDVVAALWRRVSPERVAAADVELAQTRPAVLAAREAGDEQSEADITGRWSSRLVQLIADDPAAASELRRLMAQWQLALSNELSKDKAVPHANIRMTARARDHARVYQAAGDMKIVDSDTGA